MAMEISLDLINQLKLSLRKEAKLSSYDPAGDNNSDPSFSNLPTVAEAISELDASAPYLRCRNCKGKLLRGIESLICVFCGKQQRTIENPPDPIKFTSTSAYKLFLTSLNLDGSEMVEPVKEPNGSSREAKAPVGEGVALSKFLDLEIQWSAMEDESLNSGQSVQNKNPLNLGGINLDDFFVEGRGDLSKMELVESSKPVEDDFSDPRSLSLFDSVKSESVVESQQKENFGLFQGKDAQESVSSDERENLSLFSGRDSKEDAQSSFKEDENLSLFGGKDAQRASSYKKDESFGFFEGKDAQRNSSSKNDESFGFFEGEAAQRNSSSVNDESFGFFESKDAQRNSSSKEDKNLDLFESKDAKRNTSSKEDESFGLFEGAPSSNAGLQSFDGQVVAPSSDWDSDFQSADHNPSQEKISGDPFVSSPVDLSAHMDSVFGSGKDLLYDKSADSSSAYVSKAGDWFQDDLFGSVTSKTQNNDPTVHDKSEGQVVGGNGSSSMDIDWIGDDLWQTSEKKTIEKTLTDDNNDDDDDDWNDFASSANSKVPNNPLSPTIKSSQEEVSDGLPHASVVSDIAKGQEDDLFGTWDSFKSSTVLQTPVQLPAKLVNPSVEQIPEMNLFAANNNHRDLDSDFFSESIGGQTNPKDVEAMPCGTSTLERTNDPTGKDQTHDPVGTTTTSTKSKSDIAKELMSQMHDLSFMLETELSLPSISKPK